MFAAFERPSPDGTVHLISVNIVSGKGVDGLQTLLEHRLFEYVLDAVQEGFLLPADVSPHFKDHSLSAAVDPVLVAAFHALHGVEDLSLSLLADTSRFHLLMADLSHFSFIPLLFKGDVSIKLVAIPLCLLNLLQPFSSSVI